MNAIFASKLYKISSRKDKLQAAISNPINAELVKQLNSYIEEPEDVSEELESVDIKPADVQNFASEETDTSNTFIPRRSEVSKPLESNSTKVNEELESKDAESDEVEYEESKEAEIVDDASESEKEDKLRVFHKTGSSDEEGKDDSEIEESTIVSSTIVEDVCCNIAKIDAEILKGTLNSREDTKGVSRVVVKDSEVWIYYQDKVNLNNIMEPAIGLLGVSGFNHLEFNRLARSSNAIVFEISCVPVEYLNSDEVKS